MSHRAWLEVKPEATAALEKIIGGYISRERKADTDSSVVINSELPHRGKAQTPSKDSRQAGAPVNPAVRLIVYPILIASSVCCGSVFGTAKRCCILFLGVTGSLSFARVPSAGPLCFRYLLILSTSRFFVLYCTA